MVDLKLSDLFILVSSDSNELCLLEYVSSEGSHMNPAQIVASDDVETRLILVHRVENRLKISVRR